MEIKDIITKVQIYSPEADCLLIRKAFDFADLVHQGQKRKSGEPYIVHPLTVANILADYRLDTTSIVVGLLHDTLEDGNIKFTDLVKEFGTEIADLVNGVTKVGEIPLGEAKEEEFVENLRKMILAMAKDIRVIIVKLADRLHNMQTLQYLSKERQIKNAKETLDIYAPLAERLGMGEMKGSLEDLAFPYLFSKEYCWLVNYTKEYYKKTEEFLKDATREIYKELAEEGIRAKISSRPKHLYSLWCKLLRPEINKDINKIYDLVAMRILVDSVKDCYGALGVVHSKWKPVPAKGVSDFIAQPKPNGYRSLHTTVFSLKGRILEVQIRTFEMHEQAENGIAAHWYYSSQKSKPRVSDEKTEKGFFAPDEKLSWVKRLVAWQKEMVDSKEFLETLKFDGFAHRIFVFSPNGDVYDLPQGATPVDFAYSVHSKLGDEARGAIVNNKMVSLDFKLKSGDLVNIIKKDGSKPSEKWLRFVVTQTARRGIQKRIKS
ncbi:MAG: RelA/SpoT family protein [Patescibacteria group bacterium]|nr:RelA/SpoT family protein [Patescibacteria group bacterium]